MKKMKKTLALLLTAAMTISLIACGQNNQGAEVEADTAPETAVPEAEEEAAETTEESTEQSEVALEEGNSPFDRVLDDYQPEKDSYKI